MDLMGDIANVLFAQGGLAFALALVGVGHGDCWFVHAEGKQPADLNSAFPIGPIQG